MNDVFLAHLISFGGGFLGGLICWFLFSFGISRAVRRLYLRLADVEAALLGVKNKAAAKARWDAEKWESEFVKPKETRTRYDNDPIPVD